jgi:hypothetical protein
MEPADDPLRPQKKPRVALETEHLATLKASYLVHFSEWRKGKSKISQKLPGSVWKLVYKDFIDDTDEDLHGPDRMCNLMLISCPLPAHFRTL